VLAQRVAGCPRCGVLARTRRNTVIGTGPLDPGACFVGEAPGADGDSAGQSFVGASGRPLNDLLRDAGLVRSAVCWPTC
jgi:DNA polymerase